jgi:hypothetical protein
MVTSWAAQNREEAMMLRIIHGKLKPETWDSFERAYKDVMEKAGKIPGLRGRWLATLSTIPMLDIR